MEAVNAFLADHAPLAIAVGFLLHFGKDFLRDFLARDSAAKLADSDPSNDKAARLEATGAAVLDKLPDPASLIETKK